MRIRYLVSQLIAFLVYLPLSRFALLVERFGGRPDRIPLAIYRHRTMYVMRNDALDRFGTRLEHRFTRGEVIEMMERSGLGNVEVSEGPPYWCAVGYKRPNHTF